MPPPVNAWNARALPATSAAIRPDLSNAKPGISSLSASSAATALPTGGNAQVNELAVGFTERRKVGSQRCERARAVAGVRAGVGEG